MGIRTEKEEIKRPAVFLNRDGTLVAQVDDVVRFAQIKILDGVPEGIRLLNQLGFLVIGITNQPVIEKGLLSQEDLEKIHQALQEELAKNGAHLDAIYTCPHQYRTERQCHCRKPDTGLIEEAQTVFAIDMEKSWFIGDRLRDVETGRRAGLKTILVATGGPSKDDEFFPNATPDYRAANLVAAAKIITENR